MERKRAASGWLVVGEVTLKEKLECQDLGEGHTACKDPVVRVSLVCLRTHEEAGVAGTGRAGEMAGDRRERHMLRAIQGVVTLDYVSVTKIHPEGVSAQRPLPYSGLFSNLQDLL